MQKTWNLLTRTRNEAALPVLTAALESPEASFRARAVRAFAKRRNVVGHETVLRHFGNLGETEKKALQETLREHPRRLQSTLHDALTGEDGVLRENACQVILMNRMYDLFPVIVKEVEENEPSQSSPLAATLIQLANLLQRELSGESRDRTSRDPFFVRRHLLISLQQSLKRYGEHERTEILDAYLLLVSHDNSMLQEILQEPWHVLHEPMIEILEASTAPGILSLLLSVLKDTRAPASLLRVIAQRTDHIFLTYLLSNLEPVVSLRAIKNAKQWTEVAWLQTDRDALLDCEGPAQAAAIQLAMASQIGRAEVFDLVSFLLHRGKPAGRRASCEALANFRAPETDELVLQALEDFDPGVQAAAARQLRQRDIPNALERLISLLDTPTEEVRNAARSSLAEFNFTRYQASFESFPNETRQRLGPIVKKVDPTSIDRLAAQLQSPSLSIKLKGLEMTVAMQASADVTEHLLRLLENDDIALRSEAAAALADCEGDQVLEALVNARDDASVCVQEAARKSLDKKTASYPLPPVH